MNLYLKRALKCLLKLIILLGILFSIMILTNTFESRGLTVFRAIFMTWRGVAMIAFVLGWSFAYPIVSFTKIQIRANINDSREDLVNAFAFYGYSLECEGEDKMVFRANNKGTRFLWQYNDPITVTQDGGFMEIEGLKKIVQRLEVRLHAMLTK